MCVSVCVCVLRRRVYTFLKQIVGISHSFGVHRVQSICESIYLFFSLSLSVYLNVYIYYIFWLSATIYIYGPFQLAYLRTFELVAVHTAPR